MDAEQQPPTELDGILASPLAGDASPPSAWAAVGRAGLSSDEARTRLARYGPNALVPEEQRSPLLSWLLHALADPMALLLLVAGFIYLVLEDYGDAAVALVALGPITLVSLILEGRAERALKHLKELTAPRASVWRDGRRQLIPAEELVPGDLVGLQEGDIVPADGDLIEGAQLMVDESALTGESQPSVKEAGGAGADGQVFAGTTLLAGRGVCRLTATGPRTRYGQVGMLLATIREQPTPLQQLIRHLIRRLAVGALALCAAVVGIEIAAGQGWAAAVTAGVSLAIAAIPEEFPMVFTLYLALGAWRLARARALVRRLTGVETLGATTVICTDKTGTLTLGRLDVAGLATRDGVTRAGERLGARTQAVLEVAVLASEQAPFDPLEQAILRFATSHGVDVGALHGGRLERDYPFDPALKYKSHVWQWNGTTRVAAKGALEGILERSHASAEASRQAIEANRRLAAEGLRVIGVAGGRLPAATGDRNADESALQFLGLVAFSDPLRPGVAEALGECRAAGIRVIMITGDHPVTAHAVAEGLGLPHGQDRIATGDELDGADDTALGGLVRQVNVFARARPEHKYRLVRALRAQGEVVAMTGDGINDAPALREADIGVAMGQRGTEVARAAATMVLLDDNFATIVSAIRDGRRIFENLRRAFSYLIAFHTPLLLGALVVPLAGAPLLLLPVHLVWLEIIVHPTASLVFESDPPPRDLMRRPPRRPRAELLGGSDFIWSSAKGIALFGGVLALYLVRLAQGAPEGEARAWALTALVLGQTILVLSERVPTEPVWRVGLGANRVLPAVLGLTLASLLAALYLSPLTDLLEVAPLSPAGWAAAGAVALATTLWLEPARRWRRLAHAGPAP